jgi:ATP-binding cassette subfamily B protein
MKLLVGLYRPIEGVITIDDVPANELRYNRVRRQIGFVTQDPQLFSGSIRENLQFVKPEATDEEILAALAKASAMGIVERARRGLDSRLGRGGTRVSAAAPAHLVRRALLRDPRLLIFDEATSALDSLTEKDITAVIRDRRAPAHRHPHRPPAEHHRPRRHDLRPGEGRIVEMGTHEELLAQLGLYYAMWRQQVGRGTQVRLCRNSSSAAGRRKIEEAESVDSAPV